MKTELKITSDGSKTIYVPELNEHYHSINGAVQESMHVFINAGLKSIKNTEIKIFEMGFGTGLNVLLTLLNKEPDQKIEYHTIELFPVETELAQNMGFTEYLNLSKAESEMFNLMHSAGWNSNVEISKDFILKKIKASINKFQPDSTYDLVYFDAFAPNVQPELWTKEVFNKLFLKMNKNAVLVTYCAKGDVRRTLQEIGFSVERLPGPPGKIHMLRAQKD